MSNRSGSTKTARKLEKLYNTKAHGVRHRTVMQWLHEKGLEETIVHLENQGMKPDETATKDIE